MTTAVEARRDKAPSSRRKWLQYWPVLVPVFGLVELGAQFFFSHRAPTPVDWAAARPAVARWYKPGTPIVVAPFWAEPMARMSFGDALMPIREVARPDVSRYPEAIEVSILGARSPELSSWKVTREERAGRFVLRDLENPSPPVVTYDFTDHVDPASAQVRIERPAAAPLPCVFNSSAPVEGGGLGGPPIYPSSRFVCAGEPSNVFVGITIIDDEQTRPRRCIWSHPPASPGELVTLYREVPLGTKIRGHAGMGWLTERDRGGPDFVVRIVVAGTEVGRVVHHDGDGFKPFEVPLQGLANRRADVEFHVSSTGGGNNACFEADSR